MRTFSETSAIPPVVELLGRAEFVMAVKQPKPIDALHCIAYACDCEAAAKRATDPEDRKMWLDIAQAWRDAADDLTSAGRRQKAGESP